MKSDVQSGQQLQPARRASGKRKTVKEKSTIAKRPLSWSQIASFEYDPEQWYERYVLLKKTIPSPEMEFGKNVGKGIETDPKFLPQVPRTTHMEYKFSAVFNDLELIGYADSFCDKDLILHEYKSGIKPWDQKRADLHGQIDMYLFMLYLSKGIKPESVKCFLHWMPTKKVENGDFSVKMDFVHPFKVHTFETKRTMRDILEFGVRINKVLKEMEAFKLAKQG